MVTVSFYFEFGREARDILFWSTSRSLSFEAEEANLKKVGGCAIGSSFFGLTKIFCYFRADLTLGTLLWAGTNKFSLFIRI